MKKKGTELKDLTVAELQDKLQEERSGLTKLRFRACREPSGKPRPIAHQAQGRGPHPHRTSQARTR